jgi:hypothetical protein
VTQRHFDPAHDLVGFGQDFDDLLVVPDVVTAQGAALAVFQPLLRGPVSADREVPCDRRDGIEVLALIALAVDLEAPVFVAGLVHHAIEPLGRLAIEGIAIIMATMVANAQDVDLANTEHVIGGGLLGWQIDTW